MRSIACILVVITHSITNYIRNTEVNIYAEDSYITWIRFALLFATPVFILLSETLISKNYPDKLPNKFFVKRIKFILIPYLLIGFLVSYRSSDKDISSFLEVVYHKVILGHWYGFFVLVIIQFYILHWLIGKYLSRINPIAPLVISFVISFMHIYGYVNHAGYKEFILTQYPFWYRTHIFVWLFYFVVAFYVGQYYERIVNYLSNKVWILMISVITTYLFIINNVLNNGYTRVASDRYDMLLYSVSVFFLLIILIRKYNFNNSSLIMLSHFSYFIYLSHMIILPYLVNLSQTFGDNFFSYIIIMTFLTISTSIGWSILFYQNKLTRLFTGRIKYLE